MLIESYFDESGSDRGSPLLCVAGYSFSADQARRFDTEWKEVLDKYNLRYFRMSECAHGRGLFRYISKSDCIEIEKRMIGIIKHRMEMGFAVTVNEQEYNKLLPTESPNVLPAFGDAYSWCVQTCLAGVLSWVKKVGFKDYKTAFFFESGHASQKLANHVASSFFSIPQKDNENGDMIHGFADKTSMCPLQAADLLAWQIGKHHKRIMRRQTMRMDLQSLAQRVFRAGLVTLLYLGCS